MVILTAIPASYSRRLWVSVRLLVCLYVCDSNSVGVFFSVVCVSLFVHACVSKVRTLDFFSFVLCATNVSMSSENNRFIKLAIAKLLVIW